MSSPLSLTVRQAVSSASALILVSASTASVAAQEASPVPSADAVSVAASAIPVSESPVPQPSASAFDPEAPLTVGPWHVATFDNAPEGYFVRAVTSTELGTLAMGNREFGGSPQPAAWVTDDAMTWQTASFAKGARDGLMESAVATPNGWVAVGRTFPEGARAWTSPDGRRWQAAKRIESAKGHVMYDVAVTPRGLIAVGCEAEFHCKIGKAWQSDDGRSWKLLSDIPIQLPYAVTALGDTIVVAGFSNGFETKLSQTVTATSRNGKKWKFEQPTGPMSSGLSGLAIRGDEVLATGYQLGDTGPDDRPLLQRSSDGREWSSVAPAQFQGWAAVGASALDDLLLVAGSQPTPDGPIPTSYSTLDLESWTPGTFADGLRAETYHTFDVTFTQDGSKAVMVGAIDYAPGIWWANVGPTGSPEVEPAPPVTAIGPVTPARFEAAAVPQGDAGMAVQDVISGGPGYIAVGGGSDTGLDMEALAWTSADGLTWEAAVLPADAASGLIEAVTALPDAGYVAVGRDLASEPGPEGVDVEALVWHSADGLSWERVEAHESFSGAVMYDVASTADGVVAVGCEADPGCRTGRVWTSPDGRTWDLAQEVSLAPFKVAAYGPVMVMGGTDDAVDVDSGRAVIAVGDGTGFDLSDPLGKKRSQISAMAASEDGFVATGWEDRPGKDVESALFVSTDGLTWEVVTHKRLRGVTSAEIGLTDEGWLVVGTKSDKQSGSTPVGLWKRDLDSFQTIRFPKDVVLDGLSIEGGGMADDGSMAFALGAEGDRPAIWYSLIE